MEPGIIRQGDVLLMPVPVVPVGAIEPCQEVVLAEGELTGHAHRLRADRILEWSVDGQRYVRVEGSEMGSLTHEDHDPMPAAVVVAGVTYQVVQQKEWDLSGEWRQVTD